MNVITSLGIPARVRRASDANATPLAPEPRDSRPAPGTSNDQRSSSQATSSATSTTPT